MTKLKILLAGVVIALLASFGAYAQFITSNTLTGNEVIVAAVGGPGGPSIFIPTSQMRNATGLRLFSGSGSFTTTALTTDSTLYWVGTAPTTWTITTPVSPVDGEILSVGCDTTLTTLVTVSANTGQTMNTAISGVTCTAGTGSIEIQYAVSTAKWYRLR